MKFNFSPEDFYKNWDYIHYETVFILIADDLDPEDVVEPILRALCAIGLFKEGDRFKCAKAGDAIIFGKAHLYIDMDSCDSVN